MFRARAASRLHFGLLSLPPEEGQAGSEMRHFGGVGLMIEEPGIQISLRPAANWSAEGPLAERALFFARQFEQSHKSFHITVERCAPEHAGLGTGTQLGLTVAQTLAVAHGLEMNERELARRVGRGQRSGLGIHGFARGGFLVEGGKGPKTTIAPLIARADFPKEWSVVLVIPRGKQGMHGLPEKQAFFRLQSQATARQDTDALCRLVLLEMLPGLAEVDLPAFGEALFEYNRRVGEMFRHIQGGVYAHPDSAAVVDFIRRQNIHGTGQSSWGPTVFAVVEKERASHLAGSLQANFRLGPDEVLVTAGANQGATAERIERIKP